MRELSHEKRKLSKRWVIHRLRRMAKLKGNYFCQCVAIIQMLIMVIRIIYIIVRSIELGKIGIYYGVIWPDIVIIIWLMLNLILASVFHTYYNYLFKKTMKKND